MIAAEDIRQPETLASSEAKGCSLQQLVPQPFYDESGITIYCGDNRKILPLLDYGESDWDGETPAEWMLKLAMAKCQWQIIWGGNYYALPASSCWLVWDKQNGENDFADCELAWTNLPKAVRRKIHLWNGMIRKDGEHRYHPTQKPLDVMTWALGQVPDAKTILDPWMGSGTTLVAAKLLGLRAIGIEVNQQYCESAVARLAQGVLGLGNSD